MKFIFKLVVCSNSLNFHNVSMQTSALADYIKSRDVKVEPRNVISDTSDAMN